MLERDYDVAQICQIGHVVNSLTKSLPQKNRQFCSECGSPTITSCPNCSASIPGSYIGGFSIIDPENPDPKYGAPAFCQACSKPFPWKQLPHENTQAPQALVGGDSMMKEFNRLINQYGERYSIATIYVAFVIVSLLVSVVLFGILHSTGVMKVVFTGAVEAAEFGGAFAGFLVTLIFLIRSYNSQSLKDAKLTITGNLFSNGKPVKGAIVFVDGVDRQKETDSTGWFQIEVDDQRSWVVRATYADEAVEKFVRRGDIRKPIILTLQSDVSIERKSQEIGNDVWNATVHQKSDVEDMNKATLRNEVIARYSLQQVKTLCEDCQIDYDNLGELPKEALVRELIRELERRGQLARLQEILKRRE